MAATLAPHSRITASLQPQSDVAVLAPAAAPAGELVVTERDTDLLNVAADQLPRAVPDGYVCFRDIHNALCLAGKVLDPQSNGQVFTSADNAVGLFADYLVTRREVPAGPACAATLLNWTMTATLPQIVKSLRAAAWHYRLRLVLAAKGPDGLQTYLQTGVWPR